MERKSAEQKQKKQKPCRNEKSLPLPSPICSPSGQSSYKIRHPSQAPRHPNLLLVRSNLRLYPHPTAAISISANRPHPRILLRPHIICTFRARRPIIPFPVSIFLLAMSSARMSRWILFWLGWITTSRCISLITGNQLNWRWGWRRRFIIRRWAGCGISIPVVSLLPSSLTSIGVFFVSSAVSSPVSGSPLRFNRCSRERRRRDVVSGWRLLHNFDPAMGLELNFGAVGGFIFGKVAVTGAGGIVPLR
jgi:hypothetical protein